jgi:hypothetical protein
MEAAASRPLRSLLPFAAALSCAAVGAILCWNYPIAPIAMLAAFAAWSVAVFWKPALWLAVVPAVVPLIGFAPWTGWLTFEELDILVLGAAAGAYARMAIGTGAGVDSTPGDDRDPRRAQLSIVPLFVGVLYVIFAVVSLHRGIVDAGGLSWGWFQGYYEPLNSLRVIKPLLLVVLLAPPMLSAMRSNAAVAHSISISLAAGSGVAAVLVLWERAAFPGILNFSTDYRPTALFWEMHVGGAALDGFLMLTAPFVLRLLLQARALSTTALATAVAGLVGYASLTLFSRGVYLAMPVSLTLLFLLLHTQRSSKASIRWFDVAVFAVLLAAAIAVSYVAFRAGGYRTLGALLCAFAVLIPLAAIARQPPLRQWLFALGAGVAVGIVGVLVAASFSKGAYVVFAAALACCIVLLLKASRDPNPALLTLALAAYVWLLVAAGYVALYWGGDAALEDSVVSLGFLAALLVFSASSSRPIWPGEFGARVVVVGLVAAIAGTVAIFFGGAYMTDRFASSGLDLAARMHHWKSSIGLLHGSRDWLLGKGTGRYPASYYFGSPEIDMPGSSHLDVRDGKVVLVLTGPTNPIIGTEAFRVAQRVRANAGTQTVSFEARTRDNAMLDVQVCEKHLLYVEGCAFAQIPIKATNAAWKRTTVALDGSTLTGGAWYAPRLAFFSIALESERTTIEVRDLSVLGPDGRSLIRNADFADGMAHWFVTSDRSHLPWHVKNIALNVLFDQGIVGVVLLTMLLCIALWRLTVGHARAHPLAPYLAAALVGFLIVGIFDSLLDAPRIAFLFYLVLLLGLAVRVRAPLRDGV